MKELLRAEKQPFFFCFFALGVWTWPRQRSPIPSVGGLLVARPHPPPPPPPRPPPPPPHPLPPPPPPPHSPPPPPPPPHPIACTMGWYLGQRKPSGAMGSVAPFCKKMQGEKGNVCPPLECVPPRTAPEVPQALPSSARGLGRSFPRAPPPARRSLSVTKSLTLGRRKSCFRLSSPTTRIPGTKFSFCALGNPYPPPPAY